MSKELPYFRFTVQDWQNGKISLENYELKGLFVDICGYYWINDCSITLTMLNKRFSIAKAMITELINLDIIKHELRHDKVQIEFLNNQYDLLSEKRKLRQIAGSKGGNAKAMLKQKRSYKDKDKDKDKDNIPEFLEFKNFALENEKSLNIKALELKYKSWVENKWMDGNNKKIKNWKSKLLNTIQYLPKDQVKIDIMESSIKQTQNKIKRMYGEN